MTSIYKIWISLKSYLEAFYKPHEEFTQATKQHPHAVKLEKPKTSQSKSRIPRFSPERVVKKTDSEKEAKERTKRIYQRSHEYKGLKELSTRSISGCKNVQKRDLEVYNYEFRKEGLWGET